MWSNGWGFEPFVEKLVENAIPPYLIGYERLTMEPYVARATTVTTATATATAASLSSNTDPGLTIGTGTGTSLDTSEPDQLTKDSNCWRRLEQELTKFVSQQRAAGKNPTDQDLQAHARQIIFEDDDPWNWTCADNKQWLDTFKYQQGLSGFTEAMSTQNLAEVPIMAPYVIPGGLKSKHASTTNTNTNANTNTRPNSQRNLSSSESALDFGGSLPNIAVSSTAAAAATMTATATATGTFDHAMDFDFDSIDFSNLDLGMMDDDMTFDLGLDGQQTSMNTNNNNNNILTNTLTNTTASYSSSIPGDDIFGSYSIHPLMGTGLTNSGMSGSGPVSVPMQQMQIHQHQQQQQQQQQQPESRDFIMTEQDLKEMIRPRSGLGSGGYMTGFN
jgi:hypothetical protein